MGRVTNHLELYLHLMDIWIDCLLHLLPKMVAWTILQLSCGWLYFHWKHMQKELWYREILFVNKLKCNFDFYAWILRFSLCFVLLISWWCYHKALVVLYWHGTRSGLWFLHRGVYILLPWNAGWVVFFTSWGPHCVIIEHSVGFVSYFLGSTLCNHRTLGVMCFLPHGVHIV
jgi:hypothetical protein